MDITSTPPPTDVAVNQGLYQVIEVLRQASLKQQRLDNLGNSQILGDMHQLKQEIEDLKLQAGRLLHQELGHYADHLAIGWSRYLDTYGIHPLS